MIMKSFGVISDLFRNLIILVIKDLDEVLNRVQVDVTSLLRIVDIQNNFFLSEHSLTCNAKKNY